MVRDALTGYRLQHTVRGMRTRRNVPKRPETSRRRAVAYVRVSTARQAKSGLSLTSQQERLQAWATMQGDVDLLDVVVDGGESAKDLDRPGAERVLDMIRNRQVDVVVVAKLDRLLRSTADLDRMLKLVAKYDVTLVSLHETLDTSTACGRCVARVMASIGQMEREQGGERTRDALAVLRSSGRRYSNVPPTGFRFVDGRMVADDRESRMLAALRSMGHDRREDMLSLRDMSRALAEAGFLSRTGKPLTATQVARLVDRMEAAERNAA